MLRVAVAIMLGVIGVARGGLQAEESHVHASSRWAAITSVKGDEVEFGLGTRDGVWPKDQLRVYRRDAWGAKVAVGRLTVDRAAATQAVGTVERFLPAVGDEAQRLLPIEDDEEHPFNKMIGSYVEIEFFKGGATTAGHRYRALMLNLTVDSRRDVDQIEVVFPSSGPARDPRDREPLIPRKYYANSIKTLRAAGIEYVLDAYVGKLVLARVLEERTRERERLAILRAVEAMAAEQARLAESRRRVEEARREEERRVLEAQAEARRQAELEAARIARREKAEREAIAAYARIREEQEARRIEAARARESQESGFSSFINGVGFALSEAGSFVANNAGPILKGALVLGAVYSTSQYAQGGSVSPDAGASACGSCNSCRGFFPTGLADASRGDMHCVCGHWSREHHSY